MKDLNQVIVSGRIVKDVSFKQCGEYGIYSFDLAINQSVKLKSGEWKENTIFIKITFFANKSNDRILSNLGKGEYVLVSGYLRLENWTNQAGEKKEKLSIVGRNIYKVVVPPKSVGNMQQEERSYEDVPPDISGHTGKEVPQQDDEEVPF